MALGVPEARSKMYMPIIPTMSASQALGTRLFDIMLISVHGTTPKNSSRAVQHWMDEPTSSFACIQSSTTAPNLDRKSTRLNSSHGYISYAVFCLKKKKNKYTE